MTFADNEFFVGMIAYFTIDQLRANGNVRKTGGSPNASPRPFVAYAQDDAGDTYWTALTTQETQPNRTLIEEPWIQNATGRLRTDPVVVNDGGHTYAGQAAEFATLSEQHDKFATANRPCITTDGVAAVLAAVVQRGGLFPT